MAFLVILIMRSSVAGILGISRLINLILCGMLKAKTKILTFFMNCRIGS